MEVLSSASTVVFCAGQTSESPKVVAIGQKIVGGIWKSSAKTVETFVAAFKNVTMTLPVSFSFNLARAKICLLIQIVLSLLRYKLASPQALI